MGAELIINRSEEGYRFWKDEHTQDPKEWKRFGAKIRELTGGEDIDIVFEHPGRETFGASVFVTRKGGTITTCASTSGYMHEYDNRYLWMNLKRIISSHFANYRESWEANRLIAKGKIHPTLSRTYPLEEVGQAALDVHQNAHQGKVGVLCLAPEEGLGVRERGDARPAPGRRSTASAGSETRITHRRRNPVRGSGPRAGVGCFASIGDTGPDNQHASRERCAAHMSDEGLSIFDDEPETTDASVDDEATQVMPAVGKPEPAAPAPPPAGEARRAQKPQASPPPATRRRRPATPAATARGDPRPAARTAHARRRRRRAAAPARPARRRPPRPVPLGGRRPARPLAGVPAGTPRRLRQGGRRRPRPPARQREVRAGAQPHRAEQRVIELERRARAARERARRRTRTRRTPGWAAAPARCSGSPRRRPPRSATAPQRDAEEIREQAGRDAKAIRADGSREAEDMRIVQLKELDETRARIIADAEQERAMARRPRPRTCSPRAKREADQIRLAAQQETNELRVAAKREAEQARAAADREVQEARRTLAVEKERLAREATDHHATRPPRPSGSSRRPSSARPPPSSARARRRRRPTPPRSSRSRRPRRC